MITIGANGNKIAYGIKHFNLDAETDMEKLPKANLAMGCTCFIIENSKHYMLNGNHEWKEVKPFGSGDVIYEGGTPDDTPSEDDDDEVIYEGGQI